jgi:hypothetical protein
VPASDCGAYIRQEAFLFRSRLQGQKLSYKHIANRLDKSVLACRLHYHHMTVGRKGRGRRSEEFDEENLSENSETSSPPSLPPSEDVSSFDGRTCQRERSNVSLPPQPQLPSFETFLRDTFHHQRSTSMPGPVGDSRAPKDSRDAQVHNSTRPARTLSGTWLREYSSLDATIRPPPQLPPVFTASHPRPSMHQALPGLSRPSQISRYQSMPYENSH